MTEDNRGPQGEDPNKREEPKIYLDKDHKVEIPVYFKIGDNVIEVDQERFRFSNQRTWPPQLRTDEGRKEVHRVLAKLRAARINEQRRGQDVVDELTKHAGGEQPQAPTDRPVDSGGRELVGHVVNPANEKLKIRVTDEPGDGGANHRYEITGFDAATNPSQDPNFHLNGSVILFQNGPIPVKGVNGVTQEALLEIVADRLRSFQKGPFACRENALALTKIEEAQHWLQQRTLSRMRLGVEGTHEKRPEEG